MPGRAKQTLQAIGSTALRHFSRNRAVASLFPFKSPPILLLSYPRSGSSWIGKVLSTSASAAYLSEPITKPYLTQRGGKYALVDVNSDASALSVYRELGDEAFRGIPSTHPHVVDDLHDFSIFRRSRRRVLIKEVNPNAAELYCRRYSPTVLLLLRHPAAVASSFSQCGWLGAPDNQLDTGDADAGVWEKFGHAYGSSMKHALAILKTHTDHGVIEYEDVALDPETRFEKLFRLLALEIPNDYEKVIRTYCYSRKAVENEHQTERMSSDMVYKWRKELSRQEIAWIRKGFILSGLEFYADDADWRSD